LGRDRTRHQVAEVTSLGLVQMTRKRMGLGLVEAFSEPCPHCGGRGILLHDTPADTGAAEPDKADGDRGGRKGRKRGRGRDGDDASTYEPLVVERITADAKPDPRGPKAPKVFRHEDEGPAEIAPDGSAAQSAADTVAEQPAAVTEQPAAVTVAEQPGGMTEHNAEPAPQESAAPAADGLGGPAAEQSGEAVAKHGAEAATEPPPAADTVANGSAAVAAPPAKPVRRRRAAGRPAGAPDTSTAAVDIVVPVTASNGGPATDATDGTTGTTGPGDGPGEQQTGADATDKPVADPAEKPAAKPRRRRAASRAAGPVTD
ncbi:MAG TPA: hypothetical protein VFM01_19710, partial [Nakamurella sp.]|nr:hypothetical protein [Nakamurella sp.]